MEDALQGDFAERLTGDARNASSASGAGPATKIGVEVLGAGREVAARAGERPGAGCAREVMTSSKRQPAIINSSH